MLQCVIVSILEEIVNTNSFLTSCYKSSRNRIDGVIRRTPDNNSRMLQTIFLQLPSCRIVKRQERLNEAVWRSAQLGLPKIDITNEPLVNGVMVCEGKYMSGIDSEHLVVIPIRSSRKEHSWLFELPHGF